MLRLLNTYLKQAVRSNNVDQVDKIKDDIFFLFRARLLRFDESRFYSISVPVWERY